MAPAGMAGDAPRRGVGSPAPRRRTRPRPGARAATPRRSPTRRRLARVRSLAGINRKFFGFNDTLDRWVLEPVAKGWDDVAPEPVERHRELLRNLRFPVNLVNNILQGKGVEGAKTVGRFTVNTLLGAGGFLDPASDLGLEPGGGGLRADARRVGRAGRAVPRAAVSGRRACATRPRSASTRSPPSPRSSSTPSSWPARAHRRRSTRAPVPRRRQRGPGRLARLLHLRAQRLPPAPPGGDRGPRGDAGPERTPTYDDSELYTVP